MTNYQEISDYKNNIEELIAKKINYIGESTENNEIYIEKDTGLYVKSSNGTSTAEREYEFDNVSDEVFEEPNLEGYEIRE